MFRDVTWSLPSWEGHEQESALEGVAVTLVNGHVHDFSYS